MQRRAVRKGAHVGVGAAGQPRPVAQRPKRAVALALVGALPPQAAAEEAVLHAGRQAGPRVAAGALQGHAPALIAATVVAGTRNGHAPAGRMPLALHIGQGGPRAAARAPRRRSKEGPVP